MNESNPRNQDSSERCTESNADQLRSAAAALSGRYGLDFSVSERPGHVEVSATLPCLRDVRNDLAEASSNSELVAIGEWEIDNRSVVGTLFLEPGDEQLGELVAIERGARPNNRGGRANA